MNQGKINIPTTAQTDQMFSHFQSLAYFIGAAKLPFRIPATNAKPTAKGTFDIEESSVIQKSEIRNQKLEIRRLVTPVSFRAQRGIRPWFVKEASRARFLATLGMTPGLVTCHSSLVTVLSARSLRSGTSQK